MTQTLPSCKWRGAEVLPEHWACASPLLVVTGAAVGLPADAVVGKVIAPTDQTFRDAERWRQGPVACAICCHEWTAVRPDGTNTGMECPKCHAMAGFEVEP